MTIPRFPCALCHRFVFSLLLIVVLLPNWNSRSRLRAALPPKDKNKDDYALIFGTVWGPDDRPVYGVKVKIRRARDKAKKARWEVYSNHSGEFAQRVPAGENDYVLWADLKGFKATNGKPVRLVKEVAVHVYYDERVDTGLHLAQ